MDGNCLPKTPRTEHNIDKSDKRNAEIAAEEKFGLKKNGKILSGESWEKKPIKSTDINDDDDKSEKEKRMGEEMRAQIGGHELEPPSLIQRLGSTLVGLLVKAPPQAPPPPPSKTFWGGFW